MRVHQKHDFCLDLIKQVSAGSYVPAGFQRPYVWDRDDVIALFDSMVDRLPVGSFLLWTPAASVPIEDVAKTRLGPLPIGSGRTRSLILDGQNRLASLAWAMTLDPWTHADRVADHERNVWCDPSVRFVANGETGRFEFVSWREADEGPRVPGGILCHTIGLAQYLTKTPGAYEALNRYPNALDRLDAMSRAIVEARVTVTDIQDATAEEARSVFLRVARAGVPMTEDEFNMALGWALPDHDDPCP